MEKVDERQLSQISQDKPEGNTKSSGPGTQVYLWTWTIPYESWTASQLSQHLKVYCKKFTFSGEIGASGYKHWQGQCSFKVKEYFAGAKNILGNDAHIEQTKMYMKSMNYTKKKDETYFEGPFDENSVFLKLPEKLYPWQQEVVGLCMTESNDRTLYWYWDEGGCTGKTTLCKVLVSLFGAEFVASGRMADMTYAISEQPKIICVNITRSNEEHVNYGAIEAIKDGLVFSSKYESKAKLYNSPHVVVFANFPPVERHMSKDRWIVKRLTEVQ